MRALIGHTGFVGGNLLRQQSYDALYNSQNIDEIRGRGFDVIVCAGVPAEKWRANRDPDHDWKHVHHLVSAIEQARSSYFVLISTVDVYPKPRGVDESTPIDLSKLSPYGRHRRELEIFVSSRFPKVLIMRLPALFGPGLKKNAVYDLIHDNNVEQIDGRGIFQFYDLNRLSEDIRRASDLGLDLLNLATEPIPIRKIAERYFSRQLTELTSGQAPRYDFRSLHSSGWGRDDGYLYSRSQILSALSEFIREVPL